MTGKTNHVDSCSFAPERFSKFYPHRDSEKQNLEKTELQSFTLTQGSVLFYSVSSETVAISNTIVRQYK